MIFLIGGDDDGVNRVRQFFAKFGSSELRVIGQSKADRSIRTYPAIEVKNIEDLVEALSDASGTLVIASFSDADRDFGDVRYMISLRSND